MGLLSLRVLVYFPIFVRSEIAPRLTLDRSERENSPPFSGLKVKRRTALSRFPKLSLI